MYRSWMTAQSKSMPMSALISGDAVVSAEATANAPLKFQPRLKVSESNCSATYTTQFFTVLGLRPCSANHLQYCLRAWTCMDHPYDATLTRFLERSWAVYKSPDKKKQCFLWKHSQPIINLSSIYHQSILVNWCQLSLPTAWTANGTASVWQLEEYQVRLTIPERNDHLGVATKDVTNSEQWWYHEMWLCHVITKQSQKNRRITG